MTEKNPNAVNLGRLGGQSTSEAKKASSKANALKAQEALRKKREMLSTPPTVPTA